MHVMGAAVVASSVRLTVCLAAALCAMVATARAGTDDVAEARKILKEADRMASKLEQGFVRDTLFHDIALAEAQAQDVNEAVHVAAHIDESLAQAATVEQIVEVLATSGRIQEALQTAATIKDPENRAGAMQIIVIALVHDGRLPQAVDIAQRIDIDAVRSGAFRDVAIAQARPGTSRARWRRRDPSKTCIEKTLPWKASPSRKRNDDRLKARFRRRA